MELSDLAQRLLRIHAQEPNRVFHGVNALGPTYSDPDLDRLEKAYDELMTNRLLERSSAVASFFGVPKALYKISAEGLKQVRQESAA